MPWMNEAGEEPDPRSSLRRRQSGVALILSGNPLMRSASSFNPAGDVSDGSAWGLHYCWNTEDMTGVYQEMKSTRDAADQASLDPMALRAPQGPSELKPVCRISLL